MVFDRKLIQEQIAGLVGYEGIAMKYAVVFKKMLKDNVSLPQVKVSEMILVAQVGNTPLNPAQIDSMFAYDDVINLTFLLNEDSVEHHTFRFGGVSYALTTILGDSMYGVSLEGQDLTNIAIAEIEDGSDEYVLVAVMPAQTTISLGAGLFCSTVSTLQALLAG